MVTQTYTISTVKNSVPPKVKMSQYDSASRTIVFTVVDSSGAEVNLTGKTVTVEGTRIDGHAFVSECTVSGATATFTETVDMTNQAGDHPAELVVRENGQRLGTMNFIISVEPAAMDENASITPEDQSLFDQLYTSIDDAEAEIGTARDAALAKIEQGLASGSPLVANTAAEMTDTDEVYLYTGSESGYTAGSWYYYNGTAWVVGGVYGAGTTDATLSLAGVAADAKATGDAVGNLNSAFTQLESEVKTKTEITSYATNTAKRIYESGGKWWCWGTSGTTVKRYVLEAGAKYTLTRAEGNVLYGFTNTTEWNTELFGGGEATSPVEFTADGTYLYLYAQDINTTYPNGVCTLQKEAPNFANSDELVNNTFVSGYGTLDGWDTHAIAFSKLMADVEEAEGFLYFTDSHFMAMTNGTWKPILYAIMSYLEKLYYASPCSFVLNGGDWLGTGEPRLDFLPKLSVLNGAFRRNFDKYAMLVGNHECGNQSEEGTMFTHNTIANTLLANVGRTYYTFDANTFKLYCLDSWQSAALDTFAEKQIAWFARNLESETSKHIVVALHILYDNETLRPFGEQISLCAEAYNAKNTYSYDGTTYDFSSATGKVGFIIAGHEHADKSGTVNNIPYIITRNLTGYSVTDIKSEALPLDLMKVDWDSATLTAYRVSRGTGGGTTRTLSIIA